MTEIENTNKTIGIDRSVSLGQSVVDESSVMNGTMAAIPFFVKDQKKGQDLKFVETCMTELTKEVKNLKDELRHAYLLQYRALIS